MVKLAGTSSDDTHPRPECNSANQGDVKPPEVKEMLKGFGSETRQSGSASSYPPQVWKKNGVVPLNIQGSIFKADVRLPPSSPASAGEAAGWILIIICCHGLSFRWLRVSGAHQKPVSSGEWVGIKTLANLGSAPSDWEQTVLQQRYDSAFSLIFKMLKSLFGYFKLRPSALRWFVSESDYYQII